MLGNFEIDRPFLNLPTCAIANGDLSGVQSIFLCVPNFTITKANAVTLNGWLDAIADYKVFPIHRVIDVEDNSEDSTLVESRSNRRYQQRVGKYRFNFRVSVPVEFYTRFKAYEGQRLDAIFGDINGNIIGRSDGDNLKAITVESIMVRKITWGTYGQPCLIGITIDLAYPSQMREVVALKSEFNISKAKYDELVLSNIDSIVMPTKIKYGFLYNWWATQDQGGGVNIIPATMASEGWGVPTDANFTTLTTYLGGESVAGGKLKETGLEHWNEPNTGATNELGFNAIPGGIRCYYGSFDDIGDYGYWWSASEFDTNYAWYWYVDYDTSDVSGDYDYKELGFSVRLTRPATAAEQLLPDGELTGVFYYGNDEKVYRVTKIGTQVWLADNLAETKWSDGSWIAGYDGGTYTPITDANWAALTTAALCAYDDDESNVLI